MFKEHSKEIAQAHRVATDVNTSRAGFVDTARTHLPVRQITWTAHYGSQAGDIQPAEVQQEVVVSYLPLSHIAAQIYDLWTGIQWGAQVCFAETDALKVSLPLCLSGCPSVCARACPSVCLCLWALCVHHKHAGSPCV